MSPGGLYFDQNIVEFQDAGVLDVLGDRGNHPQADVVCGVFVGEEADLADRVEDQAVVAEAAVVAAGGP